jgi:hypothetical protein
VTMITVRYSPDGVSRASRAGAVGRALVSAQIGQSRCLTCSIFPRSSLVRRLARPNLTRCSGDRRRWRCGLDAMEVRNGHGG